MPSKHLTFHHPLLLLPSVFPSIRVFSSESALHIRWPKYWSFSFNIGPSDEYSRLISFSIDWFDLLAVQGTLKSPFCSATGQNHQSFGVQPFLWSNSHIHTKWLLEKTIALTIRTFVGKVMFLLFKMLSRSVIAFLPRSRCLLISWLQSPSAVILEPKKINSVTASIFHPIYLPWFSKGNQSWILIGRTVVEAETPILWPPDAKSWLIWEDPDAGKDWRQEEKGTKEDELVGWHHQLNGHEFE